MSLARLPKTRLSRLTRKRPPAIRGMKIKASPKLAKAPKLTAEEQEGVDILTRVWVRLQTEGLKRDRLKTKKAQARAKETCIDGEVLFETLFLVSKIRGRIRAGRYRNQ